MRVGRAMQRRELGRSGIEVPVVVFGGASDPEIPGLISCFGRPFQTVAALIRWSAFYAGPDSGVSWIATTTNTPMGVFMDPLRCSRYNVGFRDIVGGEKDDIEEWEIHTNADVVISHIRNSIFGQLLDVAAVDSTKQ